MSHRGTKPSANRLEEGRFHPPPHPPPPQEKTWSADKKLYGAGYPGIPRTAGGQRSTEIERRGRMRQGLREVRTKDEDKQRDVGLPGPKGVATVPDF